MLVTLIGYRGTGKTTVAQLVAQQLQATWWDSDEVIEQRAGQSIREIFAEFGEETFRQREEQVVDELTAHAHGVLAVGGGAVIRAANRAAMSRGTVVWLTAGPTTILQRVSTDPTTNERRPRLTTASGLQEIEALLVTREPLYRECADHVVTTESKTPEQVAAEIVCLVDDLPSTPS